MKFDNKIFEDNNVVDNEIEHNEIFKVSKTSAYCLFHNTVDFQLLEFKDRLTIKKTCLSLYEYIMMASNAAKNFMEEVLNLFSKDEDAFTEYIKCNIYDPESHQVVNLHFHRLFKSINKIIQHCKLEGLNKTKNATENKLVFNFINAQESFIANSSLNIVHLKLKKLHLKTILANGTKKGYFFENTDHKFEQLFLEYVEKIIIVVSKIELDPNHAEKQKFDETARKVIKMLELKISNDVPTENDIKEPHKSYEVEPDVYQESNSSKIENADVEGEMKKAFNKYTIDKNKKHNLYNLPDINETNKNVHINEDKNVKTKSFSDVDKNEQKLNKPKKYVLKNPLVYENANETSYFRSSGYNETKKNLIAKSLKADESILLSTEENIFNEKNLSPFLFTICGCFFFVLFLFGFITLLTSYLKKQLKARQEYITISLNDSNH